MSERPTRQLELPTVTWREALAQEHARLIDVRAPGEFAIDHAPAARSLPLFDDDQRAQVGIVYKAQGQHLPPHQQARDPHRSHQQRQAEHRPPHPQPHQTYPQPRRCRSRHPGQPHWWCAA